ncbi:MAG: ribokinase [Actinomycetota bacterium]
MSNVIVVGSINVDLVMRVATLPSPGETVSGGSLVRTLGGKGANQATAAARLGARTRIIGMVGDDDAGAELREDLDREGVDTTRIGTAGSPTGTAVVIVDSHGENLIAVAPGANRTLSAAFVEHAFLGIDDQEAVVLASLEIPDEAVLAAARAARSRGFRFVLNPAPARPLHPDLVGSIDVITPNEHEAVSLGRVGVDRLLKQGVAVVVTEGPLGARILRPRRPDVVQHAFPAEVVDTTGAGDAFSAALAWSLAEGHDLDEAVRLAAAAGALATRALGARGSLPTRRDLEEIAGAPAASTRKR